MAKTRTRDHQEVEKDLKFCSVSIVSETFLLVDVDIRYLLWTQSDIEVVISTSPLQNPV